MTMKSNRTFAAIFGAIGLAAAGLALSATGAAAVPLGEGAGSDACSFGSFSAAHGISASVDCAGIWRSSEGDTMITPGDDAGNEAIVNSNGGFAGFTQWDLVAELTPTTGTNVLPNTPVSDSFVYDGTSASFNFDMTDSSGGEFGTWSITDIGSATAAAIAILARQENGNFTWAIYQLDTSILSGFASVTLASELATTAKAQIHTLQLYLHAAEVPVPAAAPMLLTAMGGLAFLRRRAAKKRA